METANWKFIDEAAAVKVISEFKKDPGQGKKTVLKSMEVKDA